MVENWFAAPGGAAQLLAKEGEEVHIRLPSGEMRLVRANAPQQSVRSAT